MVTEIDYKKELKEFYRPSKKEPVIVDVPAMNFLMIDGTGGPISQEYQDAISTLFSLSYPIKFAVKKREDINYGVMPLEGLWWADDMGSFLERARMDEWHWTSLMMQPEYVTAELQAVVSETVREKKELPAVDKVRFDIYDEGLCVQLMHIGPYAEEGPNIARMHQFAHEQGYKLRGKHHEIYLSDPRRAAPEKLKTVIRQPIEKA